MDTSKHTPTPWKAARLTIKATCNDIVVADVRGPDSRARGKEWHEDNEYCQGNAAFIVRACNSHDLLVAALQGVLRVADRATDEFDAARAALAAAGAA